MFLAYKALRRRRPDYNRSSRTMPTSTTFGRGYREMRGDRQTDRQTDALIATFPPRKAPGRRRPVVLDVLLGVVELERVVDGRALLHELDGAAGVGRDVADGQQAVRQLRAADDVRQPRRVMRSQQSLGVGDRDEARRAGRPVDSVHDHRSVRRYLHAQTFIRGVTAGLPWVWGSPLVWVWGWKFRPHGSL